jgi:MFS family permease
MAADTGGRGWAYVGVGCVMSLAGFFGGAMIAVLVAKIVGAIRGCAPEPETGAPCGWFVYAVCGALFGLVVLPAVAIWRMRVGERRERVFGNSETG